LAAELLAGALPAAEKGAYIHEQLTEGLLAVTVFVHPDKTERFYRPVARALQNALAVEMRADYGSDGWQGFAAEQADACEMRAAELAMLAARLPPFEAANICGNPIRVIRHILAVEKDPRNKIPCLIGLNALLPFMANEEAHLIAKDLAEQLASATDAENVDNDVGGYASPLGSLLCETTLTTYRNKTTAIATAIGRASTGPLAALPALRAANEPLPCRLTTQELVDLLKMPTCYGEVRKVILKHLGNRYGRTFRDHWEFVEYAKEKNLDLDFTTPPVRYRAP
jgi:hypothetical protein